MVDRFLVWMGTGVVTAGVTAAMLAGAGVATATDGASSDGGGARTSESSNSTDSKDDSGAGKPSANSPDAKGEDNQGEDAAHDERDAEDPAGDTEDKAADRDATDEDAATDGDATDEDAADDEESGTDEEMGEANHSDDVTEGGTGSNLRKAETDHSQTARVMPAATVDDPETETKPAAQNVEKKTAATITDPKAAVQQEVVDVHGAVAKPAEDAEAPEVAAVAFASAAEVAVDATAAAPPFSGLLNVIGTVVFTLYNLATAIIGGPPILPANSGVTVRSSTLHLDCGCNGGRGVNVQADWYVPEAEEGQAAPDQLIYLQHGFLARGPWYSHTAAALAKQTNSIVVAPSITSNFLASDACWLGAPPMHEAMARLFDDDNTALADSAKNAGYLGPIPDRVVLIGHSLGGGAVIGIAGAMADNHTEDRLAGVIMLDGVPFDPKAVESIEKVDPAIPIYNLASPRYFWNQFGVGTDALLEARPGEFIGVTLANGSHVDSMRGGNPLIQFGQELVAGFVRPENGDAAQILMIDWANDMFAGVPHDPITDEFTIDTPSGQATAVPLPNSLTKDFWLNFLQDVVSLGNGFFVFEPACVQESVGSCSAAIAA